MLFNRNKYSYLSMVMQYITLVPGMAIMKIIYNIINAAIPTVYIILTALFIDNAVGVVLDDKAVLDAIMPLVGILLIKLFQHYSNVIFALLEEMAEIYKEQGMQDEYEFIQALMKNLENTSGKDF